MNIPFDWNVMSPTGDFNECDPRTRLHTTINLGGVSMHLEAIEVKGVERGDCVLQVPENDGLEDEVAHLQEFAGGTFVTHEIQGRHYIIIATPHCD